MEGLDTQANFVLDLSQPPASTHQGPMWPQAAAVQPSPMRPPTHEAASGPQAPGVTLSRVSDTASTGDGRPRAGGDEQVGKVGVESRRASGTLDPTKALGNAGGGSAGLGGGDLGQAGGAIGGSLIAAPSFFRREASKAWHLAEGIIGEAVVAAAVDSPGADPSAYAAFVAACPPSAATDPSSAPFMRPSLLFPRMLSADDREMAILLDGRVSVAAAAAAEGGGAAGCGCGDGKAVPLVADSPGEAAAIAELRRTMAVKAMEAEPDGGGEEDVLASLNEKFGATKAKRWAGKGGGE